MKYIKTYENVRTQRSELRKSDFIYPYKLYLYQWKEYEEDDYNFIVGTIWEGIEGVVIEGYHVYDKNEGTEEAKFIRGNWFPDVYEASDEEIEKYEMFKNAEKYNL